MTEYYSEFRDRVHAFLENPTKKNAVGFCEYMGVLWFNHELEFYDSSTPNVLDELRIVDDVNTFCDQFDACDEIVRHDNYCIDITQLTQKISNLIPAIDNPVYD